MSSPVAARLEALGLTLPPTPTPAAAYKPWAEHDGTVFTAGQLPIVDGALAATGHLGAEIATADGHQLARIAATNVLAVLDAAIGLDQTRMVKVTVFVASTPTFAEQHLVANGASELFAEVLGDAGAHARSAVGVGALPLGAPVEVEAIAVRAG